MMKLESTTANLNQAQVCWHIQKSLSLRKYKIYQKNMVYWNTNYVHTSYPPF
jgi:hypothetical protein